MKMKKFLSALIAGTMLLSSMTALAAEDTLPEYGYVVLDGEDLLINAEPITSGRATDLRLDAGVVFSAKDEKGTGSESPYADWKVDYEIEFSEDTTAQLVGAYESVRNGKWQNLGAFEFAGGKTYKIMKELNEVLVQEYNAGFDNTYANVVDWVNVFKCGIVFDKATTIEDTTVTLSLCMYNPENGEKSVVGTKTFEYDFVLPEYTVEDLTGLKVEADGMTSSDVNGYALDYGLKFIAEDNEDTVVNSPFKTWNVDYEIEFSNKTTAQLLGQYNNANNKKWLSLGSYDFEAGKKYRIMEELNKEFEKEGKHFDTSYENIVTFVREFNCGIVFDAIPFDTDVTLRLILTDDYTNDDHIVFEKTYTTESLFETTDTDEEIAENINNLPAEKVEVFAESIKETIKELDQESKNEIAPEVIKTLVADKIDENAERATAYTAEDNISVDVQPADAYDTLPESFATAKTYDIVVEKNGVEQETVAIPVLVAIPVPAGTTVADIEKVVHVHNGVEKIITKFYIENDILYFTMSEFSYVGIFYNVTPVTGGAVLKLVESAAQVPGTAKYDVVLVGDTADAIKYLVSGQFKVNVSSADAYGYEFAVNYPEQTSAHKEADNTWHFELNSFDENTSWTKDVVDNKLTIGTITVTARGTGSVLLSDVVMAKHDGTSSNGARAIETIAGNAQVYVIEAPKYELTVDVEFYNEIAENNDNDMTITISGGDLTAPITKEIAQNVQGVTYDSNTCTYTFKTQLSERTEYCVTVEGAGYRKAVYYVNMQNADKKLHFWNNAEDVAEVIEAGADAATAVKTNFLAGDIVADNNINIYDLSAVVSYFGEEGIVAGDDYVQYDLNRDGKIDSMDVAYVLVSWNY